MRIGAVLWPGNELLFLAEHRGWLPRDAFRMVDFTGGQEIIREFRNGTIEAASMTLDEVVLAAEDGTDPVILLALDESVGADAVIAHNAITKLSELSGLRVGLQVNSVSSYVLRRALQTAGINSDQITIVNVAPDRHFGLFTRGEVDAVVTYEPVRTQLMNKGDARELFTSAAIPGEIVDVVVVRRDYLNAHPDRAVTIVTAWQRALEESRTSDEARQWMSRRLAVSVDEYASMLKVVRLLDAGDNRQRLRGSPPPILDTITRVRDVMRQAGLVSRNVSADQFVTLPPAAAGEIWREH